MSGSELDLSALAGNPGLKRLLGGGLGLSHAYIIGGPAGSGRKTLALLLAQAMLCSGEGDRLPCGRCPHCRKAAGGIHPDLSRLGADGRDIRVDQVRAMRADAYIRPNEAERKVYLVENAQTMNASAQNALLKLLEEGPAYASFLLVTDQAGALLDTVRSRCVELNLSPVSEGEAEAWLKRRFPDRDAGDIAAAAQRCEGLIGRAVEELSGREEEAAARDRALEYVRRLAERDEYALAEFAVGQEKCSREEWEAFCREAVLLLRDALVSPDGERDPQRRRAADGLRRMLSRRQLLELEQALEWQRQGCGFYVGAGHLTGRLAVDSWRVLQG